MPSVNPDMLLEDIDERLRFLRGFESVSNDKVRGIVSRISSILKKLRY